MFTIKKTTIVLLLLAVLLAACGYRASGTGGLIPAGLRKLAIPTFINSTNEPSVDVEITRAVADEFLADGRMRVVDLETADLALRGSVVRFELTALSYSPDTFVQQYRVRLVVDAYLEDVMTKKVLWKERGIDSIFIADYPVTVGDVRATKVAKDAALKRASQDVAWTLRSRVLEGF